MKTIEEIKTFLKEEMSESDLLYIWNDYTDRNYYDDHIYNMCEFDEIMDGRTPTEIANLVYQNDFNTNCEYFTWGVYLNCSDYIDDFVSYDDLANYIYNNDEDFDNDDLRDFLDEDENNEEEDEETTFGITFE